MPGRKRLCRRAFYSKSALFPPRHQIFAFFIASPPKRACAGAPFIRKVSLFHRAAKFLLFLSHRRQKYVPDASRGAVKPVAAGKK
ncbi:MAG: hypothetical protein K5774_08865 [Clostridia bacterium]|nr:hypothetical protein [Clostridia bacterium]